MIPSFQAKLTMNALSCGGKKALNMKRKSRHHPFIFLLLLQILAISRNDAAAENRPLILRHRSNAFSQNIQPRFSCKNRPPGYYADIGRNCEVSVGDEGIFRGGGDHPKQIVKLFAPKMGSTM